MAQKKSLVTLAVVAGLIILIVVLSRIGALSGFNSVLSRITSPAVGFFYRFSNSARPGSADGLSVQELSGRLELAEKNNRELLAENARLAEVEKENSTLRRYVNFFETTKREYVVAGVLSRGRIGDSWATPQTILLNRGAKDGLVIGAPIIDGEGILLGKLVSVAEHTAEACLVFSSQCRIAVGVQGRPGTLGVLQSDLNLTLKIDFISQDQTVEAGQIIVTSGLEDGMPGGLAVGRVNRVIRQSNELWQHAILDPLADFDNLSVVSAIK